MMLLVNGEGRAGVEPAWQALAAGATALDAIERGIRAVEADTSIDTVGLGGIPKLHGEVECDAGIMDGATLQAGAVGAMTGFLHAISVARQVMERLPHVLLVGEGAARFAREIDAEAAEMLTPAAHQQHQQWLATHVPATARDAWPDVPLTDHAWAGGDDDHAGGTTTLLAIDAAGNLAAGASTSGWAESYPGRLGDSAIIGAGLYADNRYGACGCTHTGEMTIRAGTARAVVLYMQTGATVHEACHQAMRDLRTLRGGYQGPVMIHAIDRQGTACVLSTDELGDVLSYFHWSAGMTESQTCRAEVVGGRG